MGALFPVGNVLGRFLMVFSLAYAMPIAASMVFHDGVLKDFVVAMLMTLGVGALLFAATRRHYRELKVRDGFLLVTLSWTLMAAIATIPLLLVYDNLSFAHAMFETMSAMTTTGGTVLVDLDHAPQSINLWRHELQWLGGMGIIVLAVAVLPLLGVGGMQLFRAEAPGPMKEGRLTARMGDTAKLLWLVYVAITLACMVSLRVAGMDWFDALCHSFSTLSLGGFSTRDASVGAWNSPAVEAVLVVFMLLAGINFATHFLAWRDRDLRCYLRDSEARAFVALMVASALFVTLVLSVRGTYVDFGTALRHASFAVASIATTTGFVTVDYEKWPAFVPIWLLFLSGISSSSGSTGGGIKMMRTLILYKQARRELHKLLHPDIADLIKLGSTVVPNKVAFSVLGFIFLYFMTAAGMTFLLLLSGLDFTSAFSAVIACINNTGPGLGAVGPSRNFAGLTDFQTWLLTATMLLGRLEILSVLVIFTPSFWRK